MVHIEIRWPIIWVMVKISLACDNLISNEKYGTTSVGSLNARLERPALGFFSFVCIQLIEKKMYKLRENKIRNIRYRKLVIMVLKPQLDLQTLKKIHRKRLCEKSSKPMNRSHNFSNKRTMGYFFLNKMIVQHKMFCIVMKDWIHKHIEALRLSETKLGGSRSGTLCLL